MDLVNAIGRKLKNLAGGVVSSVKSVIPSTQNKIVNWATQNPKAAQSIVNSSLTQPLQRSISNLRTNVDILTNPKTSPETRKAFQVGIQQPDVGQPKILQPVRQFVANSAISQTSGVRNLRTGVEKLSQQGVLNKGVGALDILGGIGRIVAPATPLGLGANLLSTIQPKTVGNNLVGRASAGILQGMTGEENVAQNVPDVNTELPVIGDTDVVKGISGLVGFMKNPVNKRIFNITNKILPSASLPFKKWIVASGARGGFENLIMQLPNMPENLTPEQKYQYIVNNFGAGSLMNIGGEGMFRYGGKAIDKFAKTKVGSHIFDQLNAFKKAANEKYVTDRGMIPRWQYEIGNRLGLEYHAEGKPTPESISMGLSVKPLTKAEHIKMYGTAEQQAQKIADIIGKNTKPPVEGGVKTYYRGGGKGMINRGMTAQDVINYEQNELGNLDVLPEKGIDLTKIPSERVKWVTETKSAAKRYGEVTSEKGNYKILARDSEGGILVDTQATKGVPPVEGGVIPVSPFQKDIDRFTALVKQNDKYQQGVPAIGKLSSSEDIARSMGITHDELMNQVLQKAGKPVPERLPSTPAEVIPPKTPPLPPTPEGAIPSGLKERGVMKTVRTAEVTSPELKQAVGNVTGESRYYKPYSDLESLHNAQVFIESEGIDKVKETILKGEYNKTNVAAGELLVSKAMKEGRMDEALELLENLSKKATTSGQANQAWSMWSRLTPEGMIKYAQKQVATAAEKMGSATKAVQKMTGQKAPELTKDDAKIIYDLMVKANNATNEADKAKYVRLALQTVSDKVPLGVSELFDAYRYNNMLSGLPTHEKNFFQNIWNTFLTPAMTMVAEGKPRDALKFELNAIKNIPKGIDNFVKVMKREIPIDLGKIEMEKVRLQKLPRPLTVFSELMEASDKLFTTVIESAAEGIGKSPTEAKAMAEEYLLRKKIGTKGAGWLSDHVDSMAEGIQAWGKKYQLLRWAVPFLRTPFNAAKMWLEYSPVGAANLIGNQNKRNVLAKAMLGSVATSIGLIKAMEGNTTWAVPTDKEQKEWFYATKRKPFSIKVGDNWVPAQYFGPFAFAMLLPAAANYYYYEAPKALTDGDMGKLGKTLASVLYFWSQSSPMAGLGGFVKTMEGDIDMNVSRNVAFNLSQLKPYEGMLRYIANIFDPVYRKPATFGEQLISDIPGLTQNLEPYTEPSGEPSKREPINFLLPYAIGQSNPRYETYYQGRSAELQQNALETQLKNAFDEGKPLPPNTSTAMRADLLINQFNKAKREKDVNLLKKLKSSGLLTPETVKKAQVFEALEKRGIVKADRDLLQFEGGKRADEVLKRIKSLSPKNQGKHLKLLMDAGIVTPEIFAEMKKIYKEQTMVK